MSDNVLQATFQAGIRDESMRDHLALQTGRLDTFEQMVVDVQAIARTRLGGSYLVPMDLSALKGEGKAKIAKGEGKESKGEGRVKKARAERAIRQTRIRRISASIVKRLAISRVSVARKRVTISSSGKHLQDEPRTLCQQQDNPGANSAAGSHHAGRDSKSSQASRRCECVRCQRASRENGRRTINSTGSAARTTAEAMMILLSQEKMIRGYRFSKCAVTTMWEACCCRCADRTRCVSSRSRATLGSCSHPSPTTALSTRHRCKTTAFSADRKAAQLMRSPVSRAKQAVSGKDISQRRLSWLGTRNQAGEQDHGPDSIRRAT